jgi:hypothetical protein
MPVPYYRQAPAKDGPCAAFLDVVWDADKSRFLGCLLLIDARGRPLEFVHTELKAPSGFLWPEDDVRRLGTVQVAHALFDACQKEPVMVVCRSTLGAPEFLRREIAPSIPFAQVQLAEDGDLSWSWVTAPPGAAHPADRLYRELVDRGYVWEPFERIARGLREVYPDFDARAETQP